MPSPYSSKHFKEETLLFSVHDILNYLSDAFQPLFPRERIKGYKGSDQLYDTSKSFPTLALHCRFLAVSTLWSRPFQRELLCWPQCKMRAILGATRITQLTFYQTRFRTWQDPPPSKEPHQH